MRVLFILGIIIFLFLLSFGSAILGHWFIAPFLKNTHKNNNRNIKKIPKKFFIYSAIITTIFIILLFLGKFRHTFFYLTILWLFALASALTFISYCIIQPIKMRYTKIKYKHAPPMHQKYSTLYQKIWVGCFVFLCVFGVYNAYAPIVRHASIVLQKQSAPVRLALVSDLHLGAQVGHGQLQRLAQILQAQSQEKRIDVLLVAGDILDDVADVFYAQNMQHALNNVASVADNTVAILGNHDVYNIRTTQALVDIAKDANMHLLQDAVMNIDICKQTCTMWQFVGRQDDHIADRADTTALLARTDPSYPVVLLDHRPSQIDAHSALDIDIQVSGHTHKGQVFPANFIVDYLNTLGYGHERINGTDFIVSSGFGFWGMPIRIGSRAEIWIIDVVGQP